MNFTSCQQLFCTTLQSASFSASRSFKIEFDQALEVLDQRAVFDIPDCQKMYNNVFGWLKAQDIMGVVEHTKILQAVEHIFGFYMIERFESSPLGLERAALSEFLFKAIEDGKVEDVEFLLENEEFDPNIFREKDGETPLTFACFKGQADIVRALLKHPGINPNQYDQSFQYFPLYVAVNQNYVEVVKELLRHPKLNPNLRVATGYGVLLTSIFMGYDKIIELLTQDPRTDTKLARQSPPVSPLEYVVSFAYPKLKKMGMKHYKINPREENSLSVIWRTFSFLPVSQDKEHAPPANFMNHVEVVSLNLFRHCGVGELEVIHKDKLIYVIYRTERFITRSVLWKNRPLGPTLYKPLNTLATNIENSPFFWHISASTPSHVLNRWMSHLASQNLIVLRSINEDNDKVNMEKQQTLRGRGSSKSIEAQVAGKDTALLSASIRPMSKFYSKGYILVFTKTGARIFLDFQKAYPRVLTHDQVLKEVAHNKRLVKRARDAKEFILFEIPLDVMAYFDGGFPKEDIEKKKKQNKISKNKLVSKIKKPNSQLRKYLEAHHISFESLPQEAQTVLLSNESSLKQKKAWLKKNSYL